MSEELSIGEMARLLAAGRISEDTRVWTEGMNDLYRLGDCMRQGGAMVQIRVQAERVKAARDTRSQFEQHVLKELTELRQESARLREQQRSGGSALSLADSQLQMDAPGYEPLTNLIGPQGSELPRSMGSVGRPAQSQASSHSIRRLLVIP